MGETIKNTNADISNAIPDFPGAEKGIMGVKAPFGPRQTDDINDRLTAGGIKMQPLKPAFSAPSGAPLTAIPDVPGADKGLLGVKAPSSYRQSDEITDRLRAAGTLPPLTYQR